MSLASAAAVIPRLGELADRTVLVVGDVVLDRYVVGRANRLSREAPVPVVVHDHTFCLPGSAANPARNIRALGSRAVQVAYIGDDGDGAELLELLCQAGVDTGGILRRPGRRTTVKERIMARGSLRFPQQLLRMDRIDDEPLTAAESTRLAGEVERRAGQADAVVLSDYHGGCITGPVLEAGLAARARHGTPVCVDAQSDLWRYRGASCVKCNRDEATRALGWTLDAEADYERATEVMLARLDAGIVAITRGEQGMSLRHAEQGYMRFAAPNRTEVYDVVGAGDTVIAVFALALAAGWDAVTMATVAQLGAGIVIQRIGNATPSPAELEEAARQWLAAE